MKRRLALVLALTLAVTTCVGCGQKENTKDTAVTNNVEQKDNSNKEEEVVEPSKPEYAITSVKAEGYDYFEGSVECLQITDDKHEALATAIDEFFNGRVSTFNEGVEDQNKEAEQQNEEQKQYAEEEGFDYEPIIYQEDERVAVVRADENILSFVIESSYYSGGAHGGAMYGGYTFDVNTGAQLSVKDYGDESKIAATSKDFILTTIEESPEAAKEALFDDDVTSYKQVIEDYFTGDALPENYLDHTGITFMFQQYDLAPYAAGIVSFTVPYSTFEDFNEAYIPGDEFYTKELSLQGFNDKFDVKNNGELATVCLVNETSDDGASSYQLIVGDANVSRDLGEYDYASGTYVHGKDGNYVVITASGKVVLFEVSNGIRELGTLETDKNVKEIKNGEIVLAELSYDENGESWGESEVHKFSKSGIE